MSNLCSQREPGNGYSASHRELGEVRLEAVCDGLWKHGDPKQEHDEEEAEQDQVEDEEDGRENTDAIEL